MIHPNDCDIVELTEIIITKEDEFWMNSIKMALYSQVIHKLRHDWRD